MSTYLKKKKDEQYRQKYKSMHCYLANGNSAFAILKISIAKHLLISLI